MAVTPTDVAVELGRPTPLDASLEAQWQTWIDQALFLIGNRLGDVTLLDQQAVDYVVLQAVALRVRRPDDATQVTVSVDDGSTSRTYTSGTGRVAILDEWWGLLDPQLADSGAFTITPYAAPDTSSTVTWA